MSFIVETDEGSWELPDGLRPAVVAFFQALEAAAGAEIKFHPSGKGPMSEIVVPKITNFGPSRIYAIKEIRAAYGLGLKEAKEKTDEPLPIRLPALPMYKAREFQAACAAVGTTVELPNALDRLAKI